MDRLWPADRAVTQLLYLVVVAAVVAVMLPVVLVVLLLLPVDLWWTLGLSFPDTIWVKPFDTFGLSRQLPPAIIIMNIKVFFH